MLPATLTLATAPMENFSLIAGRTNKQRQLYVFLRYTVPFGPVCDYYSTVGCHNCEETCAANNCPGDAECDTSTDCNCSDCKTDLDCPSGETCCDRQCAITCDNGPTTTSTPATTTTTQKPTTTNTPCPTECCSDEECPVSNDIFRALWQMRDHGI